MDAVLRGISRRRMVFVATVLALWFGLLWHGTATAQDLDRIRDLIGSGQAATAYKELKQLEDERVGDPEFDYLLGLAALESGRADEATFAFERVLTVDPEFFAARLDMARAYFALGNNDLARSELLALKDRDPPATAARVIEDYLAALAKREQRTQLNYFIEAELGYDTNANAATSESTVFIPTLSANVTLDNSSVASNDAFAKGRVGVDLIHSVDASSQLRASLATDYLEYLSSDGFETQNYDVGLGYDVIRGDNQYRLDARAHYVKLDWDPYQFNVNLTAEWRRAWSKRTLTSVFAQHSRIRYKQSADRSNDSNVNLFGASVTHSLTDDGKTLLAASAFGGVDAERNTRIDGSREIYGGRLNAQHRLMDTVTVFAGGGLQWSLYDRINSLFQVRRKDIQIDVSVGLNWKPAAQWTVRPLAQMRKNVTDADLNKYDRYQFGITVRRDF